MTTRTENLAIIAVAIRTIDTALFGCENAAVLEAADVDSLPAAETLDDGELERVVEALILD